MNTFYRTLIASSFLIVSFHSHALTLATEFYALFNGLLLQETEYQYTDFR